MAGSPWLIFTALLALAFTLSTGLQPRAEAWTQGRGSARLLQVLLGDGRKILANQMLAEADLYFHSGLGPSVFDQQQAQGPAEHSHMTQATEGSGHEHHDDEADHDAAEQ